MRTDTKDLRHTKDGDTDRTHVVDEHRRKFSGKTHRRKRGFIIRGR